MAEKRMFAKSIVLSDAFLDMPMSSRCLYFTLGMLADDDGFVGNPKSIMRQCGATDDDMRVLIGKRYVLGFESGVIVIKHWRINNYLRNDRHYDTTYLEERNTLIVDDNGAYTEKTKFGIPPGIPGDNQVTALGIPSIDKNRVDKNRVDKNIYNVSNEVVNYLNQKTGRNYRYNNKKTISLISARLNEGYTTEDFLRVIDNKCADWLNDSKFCQYLSPDTLFSTKFERYLNQNTQALTSNPFFQLLMEEKNEQK